MWLWHKHDHVKVRPPLDDAAGVVGALTARGLFRGACQTLSGCGLALAHSHLTCAGNRRRGLLVVEFWQNDTLRSSFGENSVKLPNQNVEV